MTMKERWTVYPLLLLAIGLSVRDELIGRTDASRDTITAEAVVCRELAILGDDDGSGALAPIVLHAGRAEGGGGGRIEIRDADGIDAMALGTSAGSREGAVEFFGGQAQLLGTLGPKREAAVPPASLEPPTSAD
ncbi:MAG: hypothetical protein FJ284_11180 [Planctomycetes bacterium]|nr:hypothetical protein [Planctomycetota bacterium]